MKILFWIYIIGCMCGLLSHAMITLKTLGYCKRKGIKPPKNHALEEFCGLIKIILLSAIPIYNYILFLCVLFCDSEKVEQIIQDKLQKGGNENQVENIHLAKTEVAREIFEDIKARSMYDFPSMYYHISRMALDELEKKYTE